MTSKHKTKAERHALKIWEASGYPMPVQIDQLVMQSGIEIKYEELEDAVSGMMVTREDDSVVVVVNKDHHVKRQRFTIAHELGHYILHRGASPIFVDVFYRDTIASEGTKLQEIEANAFAAELLMPESEVRKLFPTKLSLMELEDIEQSAINFQVSTTTLTYGLIRLGLLEMAESDEES